MLKAKSDGLKIAEEQPTQEIGGETTPEPQANTPSRYAHAEEYSLENYEYPVPGFVNELLDELGKDLAPEDARLIDTIEPSKDINDGMLVVFPDESLMFLGADPTAKDQMPWYGFTVEPMEPVPAPNTAQDALDMLKPPEVLDTVQEENWIPDRHGEWWLLPTRLMPLSKTFKPGVKSKPYGPSPLGNHVPRDYAFTNDADEILSQFKDSVASAPQTIYSVPEMIKWSFRQQKKPDEIRPDDAPAWADIREWGGDVLVRGTIKHRDDDHYIENCEDVWHKAVTHRVEVYTSDALGEGVHLDYYGT